MEAVLQRRVMITSNLILIVSAQEKEDSGLAICRLTYGQSDSEWLEFVQKLEAHISDWGMGQTGSEAIKPHFEFH
ncbi:uncharacterized protein N7503_009448 [Penicillium pulvis]|uniref:uncharacterized protein n=1 Tax=Penicillium pulvis TaxID=1562058 RepID=UPI002548488E|nr:uncharacterized protein N7503_009448 [Penicillium pulvis]KAJ5784236.1 hypothetical protein N7503_009448 [Penicillium pulvis]